MGTLYNQNPREKLSIKDSAIDDFLDAIKKHAKQHKLTIEQVMQAYSIKEYERRSDLMVRNGDAHDEQMAGIGDVISQIASAIESVSDAINKEN